MFVVVLRLSRNRDRATRHLDGHKRWISRGVDDGVFLAVGTLHPNAGGAIIAHGITREELERRVSTDPFVVENVVRPIQP